MLINTDYVSLGGNNYVIMSKELITDNDICSNISMCIYIYIYI